ncbi:MAG: cytochrome c oxidase subunit II [Chitinophagaceae bacterium]|nr:cytochrome c oxidase subunit II [Chitinophagaceae bacterium]MCB0740307.1 cytochrome c oxidase subunit II [Chitinophagaceae bacterium]HQU57081.1 cytochrome c oxidase subunit II [Chitinophagaceae bacterium]HQV06339.1 cytochrome c oxidase subunit II [Chitinophagaceae bacterium]
MKIDKIEKRVIITAMCMMGLFVFSLLYAKTKYKSNVPECLPYDKAYTNPKINQIDDKTYQVFSVASMWKFEPAEIYIPVGSEVDFYLTSKDVVHGFNIAEKDVNMMAVSGAINKTTVKFEKPGVYNIVCHEYCGVGHQNMHAQVIVNYPKAK